MLTRKESRLYKKLRSGFTYHDNKWDIRFITLTSSKESLNNTLSNDWSLMVKRIRRLTPGTLMKSGYITMAELKRYYRFQGISEPIKFEYCAIQTTEGNGVIHAPCITSYIPQKWLSDTWKKLHLSSVVDIRWCKQKPFEVREGGMRGLANYCLQAYLVDQEIIRSYCSRKWLKKGYAKITKRIWRQTEDKESYVHLLTKWLKNELTKNEERMLGIEHSYQSKLLNIT